MPLNGFENTNCIDRRPYIIYIYMFIHAPYNKFPGVMCLNPELDIESIYLH